MTRKRLLPDADVRRLSERLTALQDDVDQLRRSQRSTQLGNSSLEGTAITIRDSSGVPRGTVGMHSNGAPGVQLTNNPPPARPNTPSLDPIIAGVAVNWNGELTDGPVDRNKFSHLAVYLSGAGPEFIHGPSNLVGTMTRPGRLVVAPLGTGPHWARFVAYNTDTPQEASEPSLTGGPATPLQVVADEVLDGIITETKLAAEAVTKAKIAAEAVDGTKIEPDSIQSPHIVAGGIEAVNLAAGSVQTDKLAAGSVVADKIAALSITGDKIAANEIDGGHIRAGAVDAEKLAANLVIAGTPGGNRVEIDGANGIEQWLGGSRTLWIPPDGLSEFVGGITTGTGEQFIRIDPADVATSYPRILMQDDVSTRRVAMYYSGDTLFFSRETLAAGVGALRGGQLYMAGAETALAHFDNSTGTMRSQILLSASQSRVDARTTSGAVASELILSSTSDSFLTAANTLVLEAGTDIYLETGEGSALRLFSDGGAELIADGALKAFVIPHPTDDDRWLVHGCTESPAAGVEYWGEATITGGQVEVPLPTYFEALTRPNRHVFVTPVAPDDPAEWARPVRPRPPVQSHEDENRVLTNHRKRKDRKAPKTPSIPSVAATTPRGGSFTILSDAPDGTRVSWLVKAERDLDFEVEPLRTDVTVSGNGPYRWTRPNGDAA